MSVKTCFIIHRVSGFLRVFNEIFDCLWPKQKLPKVNKDLALKLMEEGDDQAELASRKKKGKVR